MKKYKYKYYNYIIDCRKATPEQIGLLEHLCEVLDLDTKVEHD